jgi:hypothetical protein
LSDETTLADPSDISPISIVEEMKTSYLDYAMSVIVARALPDVRDGLEAGAPAHPVDLPGEWLPARPAVPQMRAHRRRHDG